MSRSYKLVEWSYQTSPNAVQFGFKQTGCFTLHTADATNGHNTLAGFATLAEAKQAGNNLPHPWHEAMKEGWRSR